MSKFKLKIYEYHLNMNQKRHQQILPKIKNQFPKLKIIYNRSLHKLNNRICQNKKERMEKIQKTQEILTRFHVTIQIPLEEMIKICAMIMKVRALKFKMVK